MVIEIFKEVKFMNKKYQNMIVIMASISSAIIGGRIIDEYGWVIGLITAAITGAVVVLLGKIILKFLKINR
ncbi:glycerol transporter [Leptotrichia sp. oral taxon 218]|uniref:glycerol transporter n=1 Tax=Leptotrichia sp. oral taxon 218 TaxID=712361 RepID=UPI002010F407|nr:glycerol transporter [Leptotrichia sp. oral taxon 218]